MPPQASFAAISPPKPACNWLMAKIKGYWWLKPTQFTSDTDGQITIEGFAGDYELHLADVTIDFSLRSPAFSLSSHPFHLQQVHRAGDARVVGADEHFQVVRNLVLRACCR